MKKILLFTLALFAVAAVSCEKKNMELRGDDIIEFKDPVFLKTLLTYECAYAEDELLMNVDANDDGNISVNEVQNITRLSFSNLPAGETIGDISEIKYFKSLKYLSCENNKLTSIDLSQNTMLKSLTCKGNQLTSINLSKNTALEYLSCEYNQLATIDLSNNAALQYMYCDNNKLTTLNLSKNAALAELNCENNQLTSLDLGGNALLETLYCDGNQLKKIILPAKNSLPESFIKHIIKEYGDIVEYK